MTNIIKILTESKGDRFAEFIEGHEPLKLAILETVHRFVFSECIGKGKEGRLFTDEESKYYFQLYQELFCQYPDFRYKLKQHLIRYDGWEPTNALHISCKPKTNHLEFQTEAGNPTNSPN